ncbi:hypothetical protein TNCV_4877811 [Trichonephila clavipes]|nr:hypothetical protein TNCV_4877811 [Trichonephila clavipes]
MRLNENYTFEGAADKTLRLSVALPVYRKSRVTAEIREKFQQLQNLREKLVFLRGGIMLDIDNGKCNFDDHAP